MKAISTSKLRPAVALVLGTRPEIIKMAPVIAALRRSQVDHFVIYTGQHYSARMGSRIYADLGLEPPRYRNHFDRSWRTHGQQTGQMLIHIEEILMDERPSWVLVQGDVNTTLAGALAAKKLGIKVAHLEAGLRSFDPRMPEEHNRRMVDHISDLLLAPTERAARQLRSEHVPGQVYVVGNTVVDAVLANRVRARRNPILTELGLGPREYFLFTMHRQENFERPDGLCRLAETLGRIVAEFELPVVFPIHPGTLARLERAEQIGGLKKLAHLKLIPPLGYLDFRRLEDASRLVFTDSGGVQEEACILRVPTVTLRDNTERPETVEVGANRLAGLDPDRVIRAARVMLRRPRRWKNPFGDGRSGERVRRLLEKEMRKGH